MHHSYTSTRTCTTPTRNRRNRNKICRAFMKSASGLPRTALAYLVCPQERHHVRMGQRVLCRAQRGGYTCADHESTDNSDEKQRRETASASVSDLWPQAKMVAAVRSRQDSHSTTGRHKRQSCHSCSHMTFPNKMCDARCCGRKMLART